MQNAYRYGAKVSEARDEYPYELQHVLLAEGDQGDERWEPQFSSIEEGREILCRLDDIGAGQVDWNELLVTAIILKDLVDYDFHPCMD